MAPDEPLAQPPAGGVLHGLDAQARAAFRLLNRWFMTPVQRAGLGAWLGSPIGGYMLLLRVRGRRSGIVRETPRQLPRGGRVGLGDRRVRAGYPVVPQLARRPERRRSCSRRRRLRGTATEVRAPAVRARVVPALVRVTGLPSFLGADEPLAGRRRADPSGPPSFVPLMPDRSRSMGGSKPARTIPAGPPGAGGRACWSPRRSASRRRGSRDSPADVRAAAVSGPRSRARAQAGPPAPRSARRARRGTTAGGGTRPAPRRPCGRPGR